MKTASLIMLLLGVSALAADVEIGSNEFPYNAPFCAT